MKIPDIGDVMNKFEVLGIVGEGEHSHLMPMQNVTLSATVTPIHSTLTRHSFSCEVAHSQIWCRAFQRAII